MPLTRGPTLGGMRWGEWDEGRLPQQPRASVARASCLPLPALPLASSPARPPARAAAARELGCSEVCSEWTEPSGCERGGRGGRAPGPLP